MPAAHAPDRGLRVDARRRSRRVPLPADDQGPQLGVRRGRDRGGARERFAGSLRPLRAGGLPAGRFDDRGRPCGRSAPTWPKRPAWAPHTARSFRAAGRASASPETSSSLCASASTARRCFSTTGRFLTSEKGVAENYIDGRLRKDTGSPGTPAGVDDAFGALRRRRGRPSDRPARRSPLRPFARARGGRRGVRRRPQAVGGRTAAAAVAGVETTDVPTRTPRANAGTGGERASVIWLGLDGLDWELLDRLSAEGKMPNWKRLTDGGVFGDGSRASCPCSRRSSGRRSRRASGPTSTACSISRRSTRRRGQKVPISGESRAVPAIWNVASAAGRTVGVVGWWATHPAEEVNGLLHHRPREPDPLQGPAAGRRRPTRSRSTAGVEQIIARDGRVADAELAAVHRRARWRRSRRLRAGGKGPRQSVRRAREHPRRDPRPAADRARPLRPLTAGPHGPLPRGNRRHRPRLRLVRAAEDGLRLGGGLQARSAGAVDEYYVLVDKLLGQWMRRAAEDGATLVINSDHGFKWGDGPHLRALVAQPRAPRHTGTVSTGSSRPGARACERGAPAGRRHRVFDLVPTVSALLGLPVDRSTRGRAITARLRAARRADPAGTSSPRRRYAGCRPKPCPRRTANEYAQRLRNLGYLSGSEPDEARADRAASGRA